MTVMKLTRAAICLQLIFLCTAMTLAHPQQGRFSVAGLDSDREVEGFFLSFREAIAKGDEKTVASMVSYPIRVTLVSGQRKKIRSVAGAGTVAATTRNFLYIGRSSIAIRFSSRRAVTWLALHSCEEAPRFPATPMFGI